MMAAQRGWSIEGTEHKLMEVSAKTQERARLHDEGYALITCAQRRRSRRALQAEGQEIMDGRAATAPKTKRP